MAALIRDTTCCLFSCRSRAMGLLVLLLVCNALRIKDPQFFINDLGKSPWIEKLPRPITGAGHGTFVSRLNIIPHVSGISYKYREYKRVHLPRRTPTSFGCDPGPRCRISEDLTRIYPNGHDRVPPGHYKLVPKEQAMHQYRDLITNLECLRAIQRSTGDVVHREALENVIVYLHGRLREWSSVAAFPSQQHQQSRDPPRDE
jgi:hypothetical protein